MGPRRDGVNVKEAITITDDGKLAITASKVGDEYHVGMIGTQSTFQTTHGLFECRVKMQKEVGHWSAFWLQSPTMGEEYTGNPQKYGTEIDIFEYLRRQKNTTHQHIHWDGYGEEHKSVGHSSRVFGLGEGYHYNFNMAFLIPCVLTQWNPLAGKFLCIFYHRFGIAGIFDFYFQV